MHFVRIVQSESYQAQRKEIPADQVEKLEQAAEVHGYRGSSKCKHNGVVLIKPSDKELWKTFNRFKTADCEGKHVADVKVVAHVPNGTRALGSVYQDKNGGLILYLFAFGNYNEQLFR